MVAFMSTVFASPASDDVVLPLQSDQTAICRQVETCRKWHAVLCHEWIHKEECREKRAVITAAVEACGGRLHCLKKTTAFASWLARTDAPEHYILLTNWRLTKPCADVLAQQPHAHRPTLAIIDCEHPSQLAAASTWVELIGHQLCKFHVSEHLQLEDAFFTKGFFNGLADKFFRIGSPNGALENVPSVASGLVTPQAYCLDDTVTGTPANHQVTVTTAVSGKSDGYWQLLPQPMVQCANMMLMIVSANPVLPLDVCDAARHMELVLKQAMPDYYED